MQSCFQMLNFPILNRFTQPLLANEHFRRKWFCSCFCLGGFQGEQEVTFIAYWIVKVLWMSIHLLWLEMKLTHKWQFYDHFWPFFGHMYDNLSQNWGSDGHFDVLNWSKFWLVQTLWHKTQIRVFVQNCKKPGNGNFCVLWHNYWKNLGTDWHIEHIKMTVWTSVLWKMNIQLAKNGQKW